jgi:hypothetical protein
MNRQSKSLISILTAAFAAVAILISCQKGDLGNRDTTALKVYLTDHPADFEKVLMNITNVEAKIDTGKGTCRDDRRGDRPGDTDHHGDDRGRRSDEYGFWKALDIKAGEYDVLSLRNGVDALIASATVQGTIRKLRITVSALSVVKNGVTYPVVLDGETGNQLYVHMHERELHRSGDSSKVVVDFDLARSIVERNGAYYLRPAMKPFNDRNFAGLEGIVTPADAKVVVTAYGPSDTASAIPGPSGKYCIRGLEQGTYRLVFDSNNGYRDTTLQNIVVTNGSRIRVPEVVMKK